VTSVVTARIDSKNRITLPVEVRHRLGVGACDEVTFICNENGTIEIRKARFDLESILGSIPPLAGAAADFEPEIAAAVAEEFTGRKVPQR
jgi:AbrB family looped-hinge helix DNA binding protein